MSITSMHLMKTENAKSQLIQSSLKQDPKLVPGLRVLAESHIASYWYNLRCLKCANYSESGKAWT